MLRSTGAVRKAEGYLRCFKCFIRPDAPVLARPSDRDQGGPILAASMAVHGETKHQGRTLGEHVLTVSQGLAPEETWEEGSFFSGPSYLLATGGGSWILESPSSMLVPRRYSPCSVQC